MQLEGIEELQKELDYIKSHAVKVGVLGKNRAGEMKNEIALIQEYAIYNEYGTISKKGIDTYRLDLFSGCLLLLLRHKRK